MKKVLIIGGVLVLIVGAAAGGYLLFVKNDDSTGTSSSGQNQDAGSSSEFSPVSTEDTPMIATITTSQDGEKNTIVMKFDGEGNNEYSIEQEGEEVRFVTTGDAYYMCRVSGCFKYANTQEQSGTTNPDQYEYNQTDIDNFKKQATYKGQQSCDGGTCDVWEISNFNGGGTATFYLDSDSKRIVKIASTFNGSTSTITYDYKSVTIDIPENAQELPAGI